MKKFVLTAAALTAVGVTSAQSSVTMFGIFDTGIGYGSGSLSHVTREYAVGGHAPSRLGFRGTEDLGGGLRAAFWLEAGFNVDDGTGALPGNTNNQPSGVVPAGPLSFSRRSTVSLIGENWGEVRLGRDFTAAYYGRFYVDPFGNAGVGTVLPTSASIAGVTSTRASNIIGYSTPSVLGGMSAQMQYFLGENPSGSTNSQDGNGYSVRVEYDRPKQFKIFASSQETRYTPTSALGDITSFNVGAIYDFGVARVMGGYYRDKISRVASVTATGHTVGVLVPVGVGEIKAAYSDYKTDAPGNPDAGKISLGYVHRLSKRTLLYTTYARVKNSGGSAIALNGATTAPNMPSKGLDLGIRHDF